MAESIEDVLHEYLDQAGRLRPIQLGDAGDAAPPVRAVDPEGEALYIYFRRRIGACTTYLGVLTAVSALLVPSGFLVVLLIAQAPLIRAGAALATVPLLLLALTTMGRLRSEKTAMEIVVHALRDLPPADTVRMIETIYWNRLWEPGKRSEAPLPSPAGKPPAIEYEDFDLQLRPGHGAGPVIGASSSAGADEDLLVLPPKLMQRSVDLVATLERCGDSALGDRTPRHVAPVGPAPGVDVSSLGLSLFRALFPERIRTLYERAYGRTGTVAGRGLRIRIKYNPRHRAIARLAALPWELLATPSESYLGRRRLTSIIRAPEVRRPAEPPVRTSPLRILIVNSLPRGARPLDLEQELRQLEAVWEQQPEVVVASLRPPTLENLRDCLLDREIHVLHYMGHGAVDRQRRQGVLYLEDEAGSPVPASATELAEILDGVRSLRLVVVNACLSANTGASRESSASVSTNQPFVSVASGLVQAGVTGVVAMQFAISDPGAIAFSKALYRRLAVGDPLDAAVTEGRRALARLDAGFLDWASPVLFLRADDGRIFVPPQA